jgi:hypothetical protein
MRIAMAKPPMKFSNQYRTRAVAGDHCPSR